MAVKEVLQMTKTNVMRLLEAAKITYREEEYAVDENDLNGMPVSYTHLTLPTKLEV